MDRLQVRPSFSRFVQEPWEKGMVVERALHQPCLKRSVDLSSFGGGLGSTALSGTRPVWWRLLHDICSYSTFSFGYV